MARTGLAAVVVLLRGDEVVAEWPLSREPRSGLVIAGDLARLQLAARRMGCRIELREPGAELLALLDLVGLRDVVAVSALRVEVLGEPEGGEQAGLDEVVMPDDPIS